MDKKIMWVTILVIVLAVFIIASARIWPTNLRNMQNGNLDLSGRAGVVKGEEAKVLVGTWRASGQLSKDFQWYTEYTFDGKNYSMQGYPPIAEKGSYVLSAIEYNEKGQNLFAIKFAPSSKKEELSRQARLVDSNTLFIEKQEFKRK